jgi:hypothetical protein
VLRVVLQVEVGKEDEDLDAPLARLRREKRCQRHFYSTLLDLSQVSIHIQSRYHRILRKRTKGDEQERVFARPLYRHFSITRVHPLFFSTGLKLLSVNINRLQVLLQTASNTLYHG